MENNLTFIKSYKKKTISFVVLYLEEKKTFCFLANQTLRNCGYEYPHLPHKIIKRKKVIKMPSFVLEVAICKQSINQILFYQKKKIKY